MPKSGFGPGTDVWIDPRRVRTSQTTRPRQSSQQCTQIDYYARNTTTLQVRVRLLVILLVSPLVILLLILHLLRLTDRETLVVSGGATAIRRASLLGQAEVSSVERQARAESSGVESRSLRGSIATLQGT